MKVGMILKGKNSYEILSIAGEGGFGTVYKAKRDLTDDIVALKHFGIGHAEKLNEIYKNCIKEARNTAKINHPNVPKIFDIEKIDGELYLVSQYIEGEYIYVRTLEEPHKKLELAFNVFNSCLAILAEAHKNNILHRDIKPENILVSKSGEVYLLDFGISKVINEDHEDGTSSYYSRKYTSPDLIDELTGQYLHLNYDNRHDLYSLLLVVCEIFKNPTNYSMIQENDFQEKTLIFSTSQTFALNELPEEFTSKLSTNSYSFLQSILDHRKVEIKEYRSLILQEGYKIIAEALEEIRSKNEEVRSQAFLKLSKIETKDIRIRIAAEEALTECFMDIVHSACACLKLQGNDESVEPLMNCFESADVELKQEIIQTLYLIGTSKSFYSILQVTLDDSEELNIRSAAISILSNSKNLELLEKLNIELTKNGVLNEEKLLPSFILLLTEISLLKNEVEKDLIILAKHEDKNIRSKVAEQLAFVKLSNDVEECLRKLIYDSSDDVVKSALCTCALQNPQAFQDIIIELAMSSNWILKGEAILYLPNVNTLSVTKILLGALKHEKAMIVNNACKALIEIEKYLSDDEYYELRPEVVERILKIQSFNRKSLFYILKVLSVFKSKKCINFVIKFANSSDFRVRREALLTLKSIYDHYELDPIDRLEDVIDKSFKDKNEFVLESCCIIVRDLNINSFIPKLYDVISTDYKYVHRSAIEALVYLDYENLKNFERLNDLLKENANIFRYMYSVARYLSDSEIQRISKKYIKHPANNVRAMALYMKGLTFYNNNNIHESTIYFNESLVLEPEMRGLIEKKIRSYEKN